MPRPRIAIPTSYQQSQGAALGEATLREAYYGLIWRAGGMPVLVPPGEAGLVEALAAQFAPAGVLLVGGYDIDADSYGQANHPRAVLMHPRRQANELAWFAWAERAGVPVLGICLGCQVINVARGGTLVQHLPDLTDTDHGGDGRTAYHDVTVEGPTLRAIAGERVQAIAGRHHQAVDRLGRQLRVAARAADGTVEAVEDVAGRFVLGVQWHMEDTPDHPATRALTGAFVEACRGQG